MKRSMAAAVVWLTLVAAANARQTRPHSSTAGPDPAAEARAAFFLRSDLAATLKQTQAALRIHPADPELLFLRMEAAAAQADSGTSLQAAVQLCRALHDHPDPRALVAVTHILDLAGNTLQFRAIVPQIQHLIAAGSPYTPDLRDALVQAASEGVPTLSLLDTSHAAGLITDWQVAGPFGTYSNSDFDRSFPPESRTAKVAASGAHLFEHLRYADGVFVLPDYFSPSGVYYAFAELDGAKAATRILRVDSPGTLQIFVDGKSVLRKDDRFRIGPDVVAVPVHFTSGPHKLLMKFVPEAAPVRVSLLPQAAALSSDLRSGEDRTSKMERDYLNALLAYRRGDYEGAIAQLTTLHDEHAFAAGDLLLAQSWSQVSDDPPEETTFLLSALQLAPDASQAEYLLAANADEDGHTDDAWLRISQVTSARPQFAAAQRLRADIAIPRNWTVDAIAAVEAEIAASPTCDNLRHAFRFYASQEQYQRAHAVEKRMDGCAPGSTAYADLLSSSGRHTEAAQAAANLVHANPYSRQARALLVRELALAGNLQQAHRAAMKLAGLAPNSRAFQNLASMPAESLVLAQANGRGNSDFDEDEAFYSPYRRQALAIARKPTDSKYSGLPAITLVDDKITQLRPDNGVSVYVHRLIRIITREGIDKFGEVSLPEGAHILELRTLKPDGGIAEPEFSKLKSTISMPALSPGATIEEEYLLRYPGGGIEQHQIDFSFSFGSFSLPVAQARFVVLTPESVPVTSRQLNGAPNASVELKNGERIQSWLQQDMARSVQEAFVPAGQLLPSVALYRIPERGWPDIRDRYREELIRAARIGPRVTSTLSSLQLNNLPAEEKLLRIYTFVSQHIEDDRSSFADDNVSSAEDSLTAGEGNRSATMIALARGAGLSANLVLARDVSAPAPVVSDGAFTYPLVQVRLPHSGKSMVLDMESRGMTFGGISPRLDRREALLVPLMADEHPETPLIAFSSRQTEQSTAAGDVTLTNDGDLNASVTITLGSWRSAEMRSTLAAIDIADRPQFFRDMANRIFKGASEVRGEVRNERILAAPVQVLLRCHVPRFVDVSAGQFNINQLVPPLGLQRMYTVATSRRFPMYIDTPLSELTTFRITLPQGMHLTGAIAGASLRNAFGEYRVSSRDLGENRFEVTREFAVPVQVVTTGQYSDFARFAALIDAAESQRFTLTVAGIAAQNAAE